MLGQRYRVVNLLGRGGMGEVYRVNDLLLGQPAALKLLPEAWAKDDSVISRFRNEVRTARLVSHPNVCRVHDLGEADGRPFLSMEFVDGEDLSSLLRRIGRLPEDKALEIARKLCAGLQAAHEKGVIHRDLKPANVMIDGRGEVLITDFGLAGLAGSFRDTASGTPAYMAPEQRAGREVTERSDIFSLGLVLHEIFTGRRPSADNQLPPAAATGTLDPAVKAVIDRCLDPDPAARPANPLAVARALPGGDPVAAALAAGRTPSPQAVAASGERAALKPAHAWALVGLVTASVLVGAVAREHDRGQRPVSPEELRVRARDLTRRIEGEAAPAPKHEMHGMLLDVDAVRALSERRMRESAAQFTQHRFWLRTSPVPFGALRTGPTPRLNTDDPPLRVPGMTLAVLDMRGRLVRYESVQPDRPRGQAGQRPSPATGAVNVEHLLDLAQLNRERLSGAVLTNESASFQYNDQAGLSYRVDAVTRHGRLERFQVRGEWDQPDAAPSQWPPLIELALVSVAVFLAARNWRAGRADLIAARRVAAAMAGLTIAAAWLRGSDLWHWNRFVTPVDAVIPFAALGALMGLAYVAMEPLIRRHWPALLVTWTRLIHGGWRDATVGRDVLIGMAASAVSLAVAALARLAGGMPDVGRFDFLVDTPFFLAALLNSLGVALNRSIAMTFIITLLKLALRRDWAAATAGTGLLALYIAADTGAGSPPFLLMWALVGGLQCWVLLRFGFLANLAGQVVVLAGLMVCTLDPAHWLAPFSYLSLVWIALLGFAAAWVASGGQSLFGADAQPPPAPASR